MKCVLVWYSQPLTSIFGLINSCIKKMRLECHLHPSHSMVPPEVSIEDDSQTVLDVRWGNLCRKKQPRKSRFHLISKKFLFLPYFHWDHNHKHNIWLWEEQFPRCSELWNHNLHVSHVTTSSASNDQFQGCIWNLRSNQTRETDQFHWRRIEWHTLDGRWVIIHFSVWTKVLGEYERRAHNNR